MLVDWFKLFFHILNGLEAVLLWYIEYAPLEP